LGGATQVTGVGIHTEWGQVMASISEDTGEETPLQVLFLLVGLPSDALAIPNEDFEMSVKLFELFY
jgi:hypothetical protein